MERHVLLTMADYNRLERFEKAGVAEEVLQAMHDKIRKTLAQTNHVYVIVHRDNSFEVDFVVRGDFENFEAILHTYFMKELKNKCIVRVHDNTLAEVADALQKEVRELENKVAQLKIQNVSLVEELQSLRRDKTIMESHANSLVDKIAEVQGTRNVAGEFQIKSKSIAQQYITEVPKEEKLHPYMLRWIYAGIKKGMRKKSI